MGESLPNHSASLEGEWLAGDAFKFEKRSQLFIRVHDETLPVIAVRVNNPESSPARIHGWDTAPAPTGFRDCWPLAAWACSLRVVCSLFGFALPALSRLLWDPRRRLVIYSLCSVLLPCDHGRLSPDSPSLLRQSSQTAVCPWNQSPVCSGMWPAWAQESLRSPCRLAWSRP